MRQGGFYNFGKGGTEEITGGSNFNTPSFTENVCSNENMFFSGDFTNLSRELLAVTLTGFGTAATFHKHDMRAYETLRCLNVPIKTIGVHVPTDSIVGFHGMGMLWESTDEDEYAIMAAKSSLTESLAHAPNFDLDTFKNTAITTATTTDLWTPTTDTTIGVYKITVAAAGAQTVELQFTNAAGGSVDVIGLIRYGAAGTFVYDFDPALLQNPNGKDGLLQAITTTTANVDIDVIGHEIPVSQ